MAVFQRVSVVAALSQERDKLRRTVRAVNNGRLDPFDTFDKLVKVGMIGQRNGVIDTQPPAAGRIDGPAGDANRNRPPEAR